MGAGWSSGISVYGVVALVGVAGRFDWIEAPSFVEQWWVIGVAVVMFLVEFVIDKIALVDTAWDSVHTFIRPAVGGYLMSTATDTQLGVPALAVSGVLLALSSHSAKASTRLIVNTSPEPVSNVAVSLSEDGLVFVVMAFAILAPRVCRRPRRTADHRLGRGRVRVLPDRSSYRPTSPRRKPRGDRSRSGPRRLLTTPDDC